MYYAIFDNNGIRLASYHSDIHFEIPANAIRISDEDQMLYATNAYIRGADGKPQNKPAYVPTPDELLASIRKKRNALLSECDWTQLPDAPLSTEQKQAWAVYRHALRDFPSVCNPQNPVWPTKPI